MFDQSFSAENFRKIFDIENRKGVYLEGEFFPDVEKITRKIKDCTSDIRALRRQKSSLSPELYESQKAVLYEKKKALKEKKEEKLTKALEKVSEEVESRKFDLALNEKLLPSGKAVYEIPRNAAAYFAVKQVQCNISKLYKVKQSNRHDIVCQLREVLSNKMPKSIIRTDIKSFYESIPRDRLLAKLNEDTLLTASSKKMIARILYEYGETSGNKIGLPRGVGISAILSELYIRSFDKKIREMPSVIYYARYVDDIVIVFSPIPEVEVKERLKTVKRYLTELGLKVNENKTKDGYEHLKFEYLGYSFYMSGEQVDIQLSKDKVSRYKKRIELMFKAYSRRARFDEKAARKLLIKRVQFLTGNTRLHNNKKNAVVGIYFSCSILNKMDCLKHLDKFYQTEVAKLTKQRLKDKLNSYSFVDGFERKRYQKFSTTELSQVVKVWKNVT